MKPIATLIVDDEPIAQDILEAYISKIPELQLAGRCRNALEAFGYVSRGAADMLLLDINMPEISGMDFLRSLKNPPMVIFTTANPEFAVESYELNALDYLVKPISFERFFKAVSKAINMRQPDAAAPQIMVNEADAGMVFVKSEGRLVKLGLDKLWMVEGLKDYAVFRTESAKLVVHTTMKNAEEMLQGRPHFLRVNKSYIINMRYVTEIWGNTIKINGQEVVIGSTYKEAVEKALEAYRLM